MSSGNPRMDRKDKIWLCAGCAHGFMFTVRTDPPKVGAYVMAAGGETPYEQPESKDHPFCLCAHPEMLKNQSGRERERPTRMRIDTQIVACDGFEIDTSSGEKT